MHCPITDVLPLLEVAETVRCIFSCIDQFAAVTNSMWVVIAIEAPLDETLCAMQSGALDGEIGTERGCGSRQRIFSI